VKKLFGTSGIRAKVPGRLNPLISSQIASKLEYFVGDDKKVVIAGDTRTSTVALKSSIMSELLMLGSHVIDIGAAPLPVLSAMVPLTRSQLGIMVTASHNPPEYNGIKVIGANGKEWDETLELRLESLVKHGAHFGPEEGGGLYQKIDPIFWYVRKLRKKLLNGIGKVDLRVAADFSNGASGAVVSRVFSELGCTLVSLNFQRDGFFPAHKPEPRVEHLEDSLRIMASLDVDLGFFFDGDADRIAVAYPDGFLIPNDVLIAFFAKEVLSEKKGAVVVSIDTGKAVDEVVENYGGYVVRTKLGKVHQPLSTRRDVVLAAEPWKILDTRWGLHFDGIYVATYILCKMYKERKKLSELFEEIPLFPQIRTDMYYSENLDKVSLRKAIFSRVFEEYCDKATRVLLIDGIRFEFPDGSWLLVRLSGTEPKVRLYCEARSEDRVKSLAERTLSIISECIAAAE